MDRTELSQKVTGARDFGEASVVLSTVVEGSGRTRVRVALQEQGRDLVALVTGGLAHVGAVAVFAPESTGPPAVEADYEQLTIVPGHKEGPLAAETAACLARAAGRTCVAVVGIHQDQATGEEIDAIVANTRAAVQSLAAQLRPQDKEES